MSNSNWQVVGSQITWMMSLHLKERKRTPAHSRTSQLDTITHRPHLCVNFLKTILSRQRSLNGLQAARPPRIQPRNPLSSSERSSRLTMMPLEWLSTRGWLRMSSDRPQLEAKMVNSLWEVEPKESLERKMIRIHWFQATR